MNDVLGEIEIVHKPTAEIPWCGLKYTNPSDPAKFVTFVDKMGNIGRLREHRNAFLFRGQASSAWPLKPKIVRLLEGMPLEKALGYEFDAVCYFRERAHLFVPGLLPDTEDFPEWLCLMQHFCAPTRMLDWSASFIVALYFAVFDEPQADSGAVWFFYHRPLWLRMLQNHPEPELKTNASEIFRDRSSFIEFGRNRATPRLDGYISDRKSDRATAQRSVLTFCDQLLVDHAMVIGSSLLATADAEEGAALFKLTIAPEAKRFFRCYLSKLNVTAATLFPGADGLGRTICETIRVEREADETTPSC